MGNNIIKFDKQTGECLKRCAVQDSSVVSKIESPAR